MKSKIILLAVALIIAHGLLELSWVIEKTEWVKGVRIFPFLSKSYHWYDPKGVSLVWWINYCANDFFRIILFFCLARIFYDVSFKLFVICCLFFLYHCFDHFMLWYDFKTGHSLYVVLNIVIIVCILLLFIPEKKQAVIKSIE